ncbi:hypothetical protein VI817_006430 [Penicillium citrinum]|nr:hypothetical protein VI817_006430 [Penicillium citrinum]
MLVARHIGKALLVEATAARNSSSVFCGTRVTRLFVAGSRTENYSMALEAANSLSMKFAVSQGSTTASCVICMMD